VPAEEAKAATGAKKGQWKSQEPLHIHDMPNAETLGKLGAVAGWVWVCGCDEAFTLESYSTTAAKWRSEMGLALHVSG
jgi:hypothetical protein